MSKHTHNGHPRPVTPQPVPYDPYGSVQRVAGIRRTDGLWLYEQFEVPMSVLDQYRTKSHGPDLFGMCAAQAEYELQKQPEEG